MCSTLTDQVRSIAVARGDLTQKIELSVEGEMSTLKGTFFFGGSFREICSFFRERQLYHFGFSLNICATNTNYTFDFSHLIGTVNSMVNQLSSFASEVTCVALEVETQGILSGQARLEGVQGMWADLTRNVNVSVHPFFPLLRYLYIPPNANLSPHRKWHPT